MCVKNYLELKLLVGKLFHVDFGFILGRDPKLLPPLMKLTTEMIDGMGGPNSEHFHDFKKLCYTAFLAIRRLFKIDDYHESVNYKY